jgi:integrase
MSLYKRGPNWLAEFTVNGVRYRRNLGPLEKQEAQAAHDRLKVKMLDVKSGSNLNRTWHDAVLRWLDEKQHKKSLADDAQMLEWWTQKLGDLKLSKLTRDLLMHYIGVKAKETTPSRANRYLAVMRGVLRAAEREWQWIDRAPVLKLYQEPRGRVRYLSAEEKARLLLALPHHLRQMARFSLATGLRQANVLKLRWEQIDLDRKIAIIDASEMKNNEVHGLPLNAEAMSVLLAEKGKHRDYVFSYKGQRMVALQHRTWQRALARAGIENFRWHDLRHSWASELVQAEVPLIAIQELGGWRKYDMVRRYAHLSPQNLRKYAEVLDKKVG